MADLEDVKRQLRRQYVEGMPAKIASFEALIGDGRLEAEDRIEARRLAHQLVGSAASYGFASLGERAAAILASDDSGVLAAVEAIIAHLRELEASS